MSQGDKQHYCAYEGTIQQMASQVAEIHKVLYKGNGTPSWSVRLDRLEQDGERRKWILRLAIGSSIAAVFTVIGGILKNMVHLQ